MNEDEDLRQMFEALRRVDEGLAPSFGDVEAKARAARDFASTASARKFLSLPAAMALSAIALLVIIGLASWFNTPRPVEADLASASESELRELNEICNSLLLRINTLNPEAMSKATTAEQDMSWPRGTDSLMPFETLSLSARTLP